MMRRYIADVAQAVSAERPIRSRLPSADAYWHPYIQAARSIALPIRSRKASAFGEFLRQRATIVHPSGQGSVDNRRLAGVDPNTPHSVIFFYLTRAWRRV